MSIEKRAMRFVQWHLKKKEKFRQVENVSSNRQHPGYDFIATKGRTTRKIEVKGCSHLWGIPDLYSSEFNKSTKRLIADFLYVVYLREGKRTLLCKIPREDIRPEFVIARTTYRILGKFKNERTLKKFMVETLK
jgi:hypothetical protein